MTSAPGDWIELREVWDGRTWEIRNGIIVRNDATAIAVYTPPETPATVAAGPDGIRLRIPPPAWDMVDSATPADRRFLAVHPAGAEHSVLVIWDAEWRMVCWYINLESDLVRTPIGVEYTDHFLDVIIEPDMTSWHWKDEDELAECLELGLVSPEEAAAYRAEGERAIDWLLSRRPPYDEPWEDWRPPESWR